MIAFDVATWEYDKTRNRDGERASLFEPLSVLTCGSLYLGVDLLLEALYHIVLGPRSYELGSASISLSPKNGSARFFYIRAIVDGLRLLPIQKVSVGSRNFLIINESIEVLALTCAK